MNSKRKEKKALKYSHQSYLVMLTLIMVFLLGVALFLNGCSMIHPKTGSLEGVVHRESMNGSIPLQDALVSISGSDMTAYTDDDGYFMLNEIYAGKRTLTIVKEGYLTAKLLDTYIEPDIMNEANLGQPIILKPKEDRALYDLAQEYYQQEEYQLALDTFQELLISFPESSWVDDSQYSIAWCYLKMENFSQAIEEFEIILFYYPESEYRDDSQYFIGWCYEKKLGLYIQASLAYYAVLINDPASQWADDAQLGIGNSYYATLDFGNAIKEYQKVIDNYPFSDLLPLAQYSVAQSYRRANYLNTAIEKYEELVMLYPDSEYCAPSQYYIGYCYYEKDDFQTAIDEFNRLIEEYTNSTWPGEERKIAPSAQYYIGWCYEKIELWAEALEAYQVIIDEYPYGTWSDGSSIPEYAQERIDWILENHPLEPEEI